MNFPDPTEIFASSTDFAAAMINGLYLWNIVWWVVGSTIAVAAIIFLINVIRRAVWAFVQWSTGKKSDHNSMIDEHGDFS